MRPRAGTSTASSITTTPACRSPRWPPACNCAPRASSRAIAQWPEAAYNGEYIAEIAADFMARRTVRSDDREFTASGDLDDLDGMRLFAVAYLRHEQDLDLRAFDVRFDNYFLESSLYTSGKVDAVVQKLRDAGKTYEHDGALWLEVHGIRRRQGPGDAQGRRQLHLFRARRGLSHHQVGARLCPGGEHPGHRPPRHHRAGARRPAGGGRRASRPAIRTTCCIPWCA